MSSSVSGRGRLALAIVPVLLLVGIGSLVYWEDSMAKNALTENLVEPLDGVTSAKIDIQAGDGSLSIDRLTGGEPLLAGGTLQYLEKQGPPSRSTVTMNGLASLSLRAGAGGQPWLRLPWAACNGATEWQIHLNPTVSSDITAHSNGGNVKLTLAGMALTRVAADTGAGNVDLLLPDNAANLAVTANTGAGNVTVELGRGATGSNTISAGSGAGNVVVRVPDDLAALIHATAGLGKVTVSPRFGKIDGSTFQSLDYAGAANRVEVTVKSGVGDVIIESK